MFAKIKLLVAESQGRYPCLLFKEIGEMCYFLEAKAIGNFGYIPGSLLQQNLGFLAHAARDNLGRGFAGGFLQYFVQVVYVHLKRIGKIFGSSQLENLRCILNGELSLQQLYK